jgi:endonuclease/exonuclease/phosphatase (EEP) superfamily protein YafD
MPFRILRLSLLLLVSLTVVSCMSGRDVFHLGEKVSEPASAPVKRRATRGAPSHFICWNVHKASDERFTREVEELLATIPKEDGVIMCLQEVRSSTYELIKDLHREKVSGHYAPSWKYLFSKRSTGVLTVGNWPLPESGAERISSPRREMFVASPKVALRTDLPLPDDKSLQIVNCHGLIFVSHATFEKQLDRIFGALQDQDQPAIVCGDFNVWSAKRLEVLRAKAREVGMSEAATRNPGTSPAPKWLRGLHRFNGFDPDIPLDRIFTRGVDVLDCYSVENSSSSDHLPLVLRFVVDS